MQNRGKHKEVNQNKKAVAGATGARQDDQVAPWDWCFESGYLLLHGVAARHASYRFTVSHLGRHENRVKSETNPTRGRRTKGLG